MTAELPKRAAAHIKSHIKQQLAKPRPGRPRSVAADRAILVAARDLLIERGYRGMSVEDVAEHAGVSKATIYRRWPSKGELILAATCHVGDTRPLPDTGSLRGDVRAIFDAKRAAASPGGWQAMARLLSEVMLDPELHDAYVERVLKPRRELGKEVIRRAKARGEIRDDVDDDVLIDLIVGYMTYRLHLAGHRSPVGPETAEQVLELLFRGIAAPAG